MLNKFKDIRGRNNMISDSFTLNNGKDLHKSRIIFLKVLSQC